MKTTADDILRIYDAIEVVRAPGQRADATHETVIRHPVFGEFRGEYWTVRAVKVNALWYWLGEEHAEFISAVLRKAGVWSWKSHDKLLRDEIA